MDYELPNRKTLILGLSAIAILLAPLPASADRAPAGQTLSPAARAPAPTPTTSTSTATPTTATPTSTAATPQTPATPTPTPTTPTATTPVPTATTALPAPRSIRLNVQLAGDPTDTISDFQFAPASITIHVGDTITWVNNGPSVHTATANGGSFDTGSLQKGQSGSHTFTTAGTFTYFCRVHPFMHGTVVVLATSTSSGTGTGSTTTSATTPATSAPSSASSAAGTSTTGTSTTGTTSTASSSPSLPVTGLNLAATVIVGLLMLSAGIAIRRRLASR